MLAMVSSPSPNGSNGRDARGRFVGGNAGGPGNPHAKKVAKLRSAMLSAVTQKDFREVVKALIQRAKAGDVAAIRELLDRCIGKPTQPLDIEVDGRLASETRDPEDMSDVELARAVIEGGIELHPVLQRKCEQVYRDHFGDLPKRISTQ